MFVDVNYDITKYLPSTTKSQEGLKILKKEFGYPGTARIMVDNVTYYEAQNYKNQIESVEGVDSVLWCDTMNPAYQANSFNRFEDTKDYYKNGYSVMDVVFKEGDTSKRTSKALDQINAIVGNRGHIIGPAIVNKSLNENLNKEMTKAIIICIAIIFVVLILTTTSWFLPVLFLIIMGIAIIINMGSNIFLGEVSFITSSVAAILQLAVAMDYLVFLVSSFTAERKKGLDLTESVSNAIRHSSKSILACGLATFFGFIALAFMKFSIGFDLGICLAKGIIVSVLTVLFLMPSLILRWAGIIEKTTHRSFVPSMHGFAKGTFKVRYVTLVLALLIAVPAYIGKGMNNFTYGNSALGAGPGTKVYEDELAINKQFGRSNLLVVLIPNTSVVREKQLSDALENLSYTKSVTSYSNKVPQGVPESILPNSITSELHTKNYARILVYTETKDESAVAFQGSDEIQSLVKEYYPLSYVIGTTTFTQDIKDTIVSDFDAVDALSLLTVALVILLSFRSLLLPILLLIPVEIAVFINMLFPYLVGDKLMFIGYMVVSCIQLGATVDYAILLTNNYMEYRSSMDRKEATIEAIANTTEPLLTSAAILTLVGYTLYKTCSIGAIADIGHLIGRGTIFSFLLVVTLLPTLLYIFDKPIFKNMERMRQMHEKVKSKFKQQRTNPKRTIKNMLEARR
jgi:predicted RND superfamily exporter protein